MPACARKEIVRDGEVAFFHCVSRCVRRAFLCGKDQYSGKDFEHRRAWVQERLEELAGIFAVDVTGFCVMSNHLHVVVRTRPDLAGAWSDDEVARRWWRLFPRRRGEDGSPAEPEPHELEMLQADAVGLAERRRRLANVSWFMRCVAEPIARRANREDECRGRFWEGRFKCQVLLDETAVLACSVYVDLNPIRARIAKTPETSAFTSAYERIAAMRGEPQPIAGSATKRSQRGGHARNVPQITPRDGWLNPVELIELPISRPARSPAAGKAGRPSVRKGFLSMTQEQYLTLLDWTGRQVRRDKRGAIPAELAPLLARLQLNDETWVQTVQEFGRHFRRAAGCMASMTDEATRAGRRWFAGIRHSRSSFAMVQPVPQSRR